ncbi:MAG TPA: prohibitin family protein [Stellaceae bacterium]|nr:prohibitin family protein [Stellaceae bacterium]
MTVQVAAFRGAIGRKRSSLAAFYTRNRPAIHVAALGFVFFIVIAWQWVVVTIPAGHVGVMWYRFLGGTDTTTVYSEGSHFVFPWDHMVSYDARLQSVSRDFDVLTQDGLSMKVNVAVEFRLNENRAGLLHKNIGPNYVENLLLPTMGAEIREVVSRNSTDETYTARRSQIQDEIRRRLAEKLTLAEGATGSSATPWLFLDAVLIRSMQFPPALQASVNQKMQQYELQEEYRYRLERERLESERKEVEAQGIARFQQIVGAGISENYLKWKGIDATLALAQSANAKVIVIGAGRDGMPLILGDSSAHPQPAKAAGPKAEVPQTNFAPVPKVKASPEKTAGGLTSAPDTFSGSR